ncbi:MAG: carboxypeptidase-like regulatory domain-containing protein, partial [Bacteroidales bacterium]|nr:carboxypeptidase-like regulatory domain-containing protein [Bacteroidales bacterium]
MKKKLFDNGINWKKIYSSKLWKIMRLSGFLFIICVFQVLAGRSYSQSTKLSLNLNQAKISQVLNEIENQSEFYFLYNHKLIDVDRKVDIDVKDKRIKDILTNLFAGEDVNCLVMDRQIVLSPKDVTKTVSIAKDRQPQEIVIKGKVTDEDGNSLPGVNIIIKGTATGTITNADGNYSIEVDDPNATLVFSFIGYKEKTVKVNGRQKINIALNETVTELEEVVAIGYGRQKKINLTGSVANIRSDFIENKPVSKASQSLAGELSGVTIIQGSGDPTNDEATIRVRGLGSFSNAGNDPLILIDGIAGNIDDVNPNDIESVSVLKDAASAAIYGARAANGVILIETK